MEEISLSVLKEKLEKELTYYMGQAYQNLKVESSFESEALFVSVKDKEKHLENMEKINVKDILSGYDGINEENICLILSDVAKHCVREYENYKKAEEKLAKELANILREYPKERIFIYPVEMKEDPNLKDFIYRKKGSIYFFYGLRMPSKSDNEFRYLPYLKKELLKKWEISEDVMYRDAVQNARWHHAYNIEKSKDGYYIITNDRLYGGVELIYPDGALYELSEELQSSLYVLFLSQHELVAVSEKAAEQLRETARETMRNEFLFYYDKDLHEIAVNAIEKEEIFCRKRQGVLDVAEKNLLEGHGV